MLNAKAKKNTAAGIRIGVSGANRLYFVAIEWDTELAKINSDFRRSICYIWRHCVEITPLVAAAASKYHTLGYYRVIEALSRTSDCISLFESKVM